MASVLVTGASGFIGAHTVRALRERGDEVTCLVRRTSHLEFLTPYGPRFAYGDVTDRDSLERAVAQQAYDVVYHLAGCVSSLTPRTMYDVNARGAAHVARAAARQTSPPVLVLISSLAVAGPAVDGRPKTEDDPAEPVSVYGRSKLCGERLVRRYAERIPISIIRPGIVFGEFDRESLKLFRQIARTRIHISPGWSRKHYSMIYSGDLARLLLAAADQGERLAPGPAAARPGQGVYFAASGYDPTFQEFGRMIGAAIGRKPLVQLSFGPLMMWSAAYVAESYARIMRVSPPLTRDKVREGNAASWRCSVDKACRQLGFSPTAPLEEQLRRTADWYKAHHWL